MAITASTTRSAFSGFLNPAQSEAIFDEAVRQSAVQQLARRVPLGINGQVIPVTTTPPVANWVAEGAKKPATQGAMALRTMTPQKLAAILVVSAEVVRANPGNYIETMRGELAGAFAAAFDYATLYDLGGDGTGTGPFPTFVNQTTLEVEIGTNNQAAGGVWQDLVDGLRLLIGAGGRLTGFAFGDIIEPELLGAVDSSGRPIFVDTPLDDTTAAVRPGRLMGRPSYLGEGVANGDVVGFGGDWSKAVWGVVGGITYDVSTEATVTIDAALVSLWEQNLVAIRAEAEYGFFVEAPATNFVRFENAES